MMAHAITLLTGIDVPADSAGGSISLLGDVYLTDQSDYESTVAVLPPENSDQPLDSRVAVIDVDGKCLEGELFDLYVRRLSAEVLTRVRSSVSVLHCQHLAFGMSPALLAAFPHVPAIGMCHGTDLIFASLFDKQLRVLQDVVQSCERIVFPSGSMVDRTRNLTSLMTDEKAVVIPWGIPDHLIFDPPGPRLTKTDQLRVLFAGRLTPEKGFESLLSACEGLPSVILSVAAPAGQFMAMRQKLGVVSMSRVRYVGWLSRTDLWAEFRKHDCLVVPSTMLEAFCLVAVEAQACGLPVVYENVPGLDDVLADTALAIQMPSLGRVLSRLSRNREILDDLAGRGRRNASRFPLSRMRSDLAALTRTIVGGGA